MNDAEKCSKRGGICGCGGDYCGVDARLYSKNAVTATIEQTTSATNNADSSFNAQRLRNVLALTGVSDPFPTSDEHLLDAMGAVLGQVAGVLRTAEKERDDLRAQLAACKS